ncbi:PQQ-binding-like beta-propeller repeat protein [uncultured Methanobacterium sp.]|uniref:outer membrane protein assembly factor BamB family protein n=1 Tax=uncultured Methanobacterium sp. TaxID=176306 RepID=UPI002AA95A84|nr:PQQ-binding-like beta-propeller repeat protein [uncultured Methanobacterium sp.]
MLNKRHAILALCIVIATMGVTAAWEQSWTSNTGQPSYMVGDGQNIIVTTASSVKEINPSGNQIWSADVTVNNGGKALKSGKYLFTGEGNNAKALNKTDGTIQWAVNDPLGPVQNPKYIFVKGSYIIVSNDAKAVVLERETGQNATGIADTPTNCDPNVFGGYYLTGTSTGVQAYEAFMLPDLRIRSIDKQSNLTVATIENIGLSDTSNVLVKFVAKKSDGTYRTIHVNAGTVPAGNAKNVTINGEFTKGYVIVDPYFKISELSETNNQKYFY